MEYRVFEGKITAGFNEGGIEGGIGENPVRGVIFPHQQKCVRHRLLIFARDVVAWVETFGISLSTLQQRRNRSRDLGRSDLPMMNRNSWSEGATHRRANREVI